MILDNLNILVTRPKPQGEILCQIVRAAGGNAIYFPTIEIAPPYDPELFLQHIARLNQQDWLIFISPQAVYQSIPAIESYWPDFPLHIKIAALGAGTAAALRAANKPVDVYPTENWDSEAILNLPVFQQIQEKKIALIKGEGGRELLSKELIKRGAEVTPIAAYSRRISTVKYNNQKIDIVISTSTDGLINLQLLLAEIDLYSIPIIVISQRMADFAKTRGFRQILLANNAGHDAIMDALQNWVISHGSKIR